MFCWYYACLRCLLALLAVACFFCWWFIAFILYIDCCWCRGNPCHFLILTLNVFIFICKHVVAWNAFNCCWLYCCHWRLIVCLLPWDVPSHVTRLHVLLQFICCINIFMLVCNCCFMFVAWCADQLTQLSYLVS